MSEIMIEPIRSDCPPRRPRASLTARQRQVLDFVRQFTAGHGYSPAYREIAAGVGLASTNSVKIYIDRLVTAGYLKHPPNGNRVLQIIENE